MSSEVGMIFGSTPTSTLCMWSFSINDYICQNKPRQNPQTVKVVGGRHRLDLIRGKHFHETLAS